MREDDQSSFRTIDEFLFLIKSWESEEVEIAGDYEIAVIVLSYTLKCLRSEDCVSSSVFSSSPISGT